MGKAGNPVSEAMGQFIKIMERLLPVGSIIEWAPVDDGENVDLSTPESVAEYYGFGTWEAYGEGRVIVGVSSNYQAGATGGEEKHTLTVDEIPSHNHAVYMGYGAGSKGPGWARVDSNNPNNPWQRTFSTGGSKSHNNMPPYIVTYRWRRVA